MERKRDLNFWSVLEQLRGGRVRLFEELPGSATTRSTTEDSVLNRLVPSVIDHDIEHWHEIAARLAGMAGVRRTPVRCRCLKRPEPQHKRRTMIKKIHHVGVVVQSADEALKFYRDALGLHRHGGPRD